MNINDTLRMLMRLFFILLGLITAVNYFRYGGKIRRDIALMLGSVATILFVQLLELMTGLQLELLNLLGVLGFLTQPYLLLRLAHYFYPVSLLTRRVAFLAMIVSGVTVIAADILSPALATIAGLAVVAYFVAVNGYAMLIFIRSAWITSGVVQQRMRLAAAGSGFFAPALLALGLTAIMPTFREGLTSLILIATIASALCYAAGFAPPRWLQQIWQLSELRNYLFQINTKLIEKHLNVAQSLDELCQVVNRVTGGLVTAIAQKKATEKQWVVGYVTGRPELIQSILDDDGLIHRVQRDHTPAFIHSSDPLSPVDRRLLELVGTDTLLVSPIAAAERDWGLLLVFMQRSSLFTEDDLNLVTLIAQQSAMFLENITLVEEMRHYSEILERRVEERTAEVRQLNTQLEQRVLERTADLSQANMELGKVVQAKDEFLANMSHELRTPLNGILILTEVLLEQIRGPLNERQAHSLRTIQTSGHHLLSLINDILDLSKMEADKLELTIESVIIKDICQSSLQFVKELAHRKQIRLMVNNDNLDAQMQSDPRRLKQILINLLSNAVKFTPNGGQVSLIVRADEVENVIRFIVQDTGIGISAENMSRLFKPFTQLDSSLTREHEGTGLGLTLVGRLVELHGGSLEVESEGIPGKGSRFTVSLPWKTGAEKGEEVEMDRALITDLRRAFHHLSPEEKDLVKVVIVEDSPTSAEQIGRYLEELGVDKVIFVEGGQAMAVVLETSPHFIVLDLLMPDRSGWDVLTQLKADPRTRPIPILIISVVDEPARGLAAGAIAYLVKPITRAQLRNALTHMVTTLTKAKSVPDVPTLVEPSIQPQARGPLLLLAEDNEVNILAIGDYLRAIGYRLTVARHGGEALELALELKPDLILMDVQMPVLDGLTVTKRLRAIEEFDTTPIIALTALAMPGDRERCLNAGASEYLSKPVSLKKLRQVLSELLEESR